MVSFSARATQNNHYSIHQGFKYTRRALLCTIDYYSSSSSSLLNFTKKSCWYYLWWYPMTSIIFVFVYIFLLLLDLVYYTKNILYNTHGRWQIDFKLFAWDDRFAIINHLQGEHTQKMLIKGFWTELYNYKPLPACKACDMIGILYVYYGLSNMVSYLQEYRNILTLLVFVWTFFRTPT